MIFGLIVAFVVQWTVTGGLSELASAFPVSMTCSEPTTAVANLNSPAVASTISVMFY